MKNAATSNIAHCLRCAITRQNVNIKPL